MKVAELERELAAFRDEITRATVRPTGLGLTYSSTLQPLTQYRTLADYTEAVYTGAVAPNLLHRALVDQVTTDNPGVVPPGWVNQVYGIMTRSRPLIEAFGVDPLPPAGMEVNWPYFDGDLLALVGQQATEKTAIRSVQVSLLKGTASLDTYAGGSDISYQLIRRSGPAYLDAYMQIMFAAYAAVTDQAAGAALIATVGHGNVVYDITTDDGAALRTALFEASLEVQAATGAPASFALAATDVFTTIGGFPNLYPSLYGTTNAVGTADAASLRLNVSGLPIILDPFLPAGALWVSNGRAASWFEEGPMTVAADDVEKLGQNVAVWGMGTFGATAPAGLVELSAAGATSTRKAK